MQLTQATDYALRTLIQLACLPDQRQSIDDIQRAFRISHSTLSKVVHRLGQLGYLTTTRGKNGGLQLSRAAAEINVGEVVRAMEPHFHLLECFDTEHNTCPVSGACLLQGALHRAKRAFMAELDALSIADVSRNSKQLLQRLTDPGAPSEA